MTVTTEPFPLTPSWRIAIRWIVSFIACFGYGANALGEGLPVLHLSLLAAVYGAWLCVFHMGWKPRRPRRNWWLFALFCLACVSQFVSLPARNASWLPVLSTATACLLAGLAPRKLGLIGSGLLCACTSLALRFVMHLWDPNALATVFFTFCSLTGLTAAMRGLIRAHSALRRSNDELSAAHTKLVEYSARIEEVSAIRERNRIARDIHDTLGHSLALLSVQLETAVQFEIRGSPGLHEELIEARRVAKGCLADVRHSVEALRPDRDTGWSMQQMLQRLVAEFETTCKGTEVVLDVKDATHALNPQLSLELYRCAQEALTNVRKHAIATKVLLHLSTRDKPSGRASLTILDNGRGSAARNPGRESGFGLLGMRERVTLLDGAFRAGPEPELGWRVEVEIPLSDGASSKDAKDEG